ncbi:hypothetical protein JCM14469_29140 [Desulfatiferula olefinivorans]
MKTRASIIIAIVLTILIAGYIGTDFFLKWHTSAVDSTENRIRLECDARIATLEKTLDDLERQRLDETTFSLPPDRLIEAFGDDIGPLIDPAAAATPETCPAVNRALARFFIYLDSRAAPGSTAETSAAFLEKALTRLAKRPPPYAGETAEVTILFQSVSHLSRALGSRNALLLRDMLTREADLMEPALALAYRLMIHRPPCTSDMPMPELSVLYSYAHFFLNSMAGRSYLMRRDSKLRILATYYALMVVRLAETQSLNVYGLDPRNQAALLIEDIVNHRRLMYADIYVAQLEALITAGPDAATGTPETRP